MGANTRLAANSQAIGRMTRNPLVAGGAECAKRIMMRRSRGARSKEIL
jgi:hypothetical protein